MSDGVWELVRDRLVPNVEEVELSALGEPTLSPRFPTMASHVVLDGKRLKFPTNGHFLDRRRVLDAIGDDPLVSVSIDAASEETYRNVRAGDFQRVQRNVKLLRKEKPRAEIWSTYVGMARNIDEFPDFVDMAAELGIDKVIFKPVDCWALNRERESLRFQRDRAERAFDEAMKRGADAGVLLSIIKPEYHPEYGTYMQPGAMICSSFVCYSDIEPLEECPPVCCQSADGPLVTVPASVVVGHTGVMYACVARHAVGNVLRDSWDTLLANPRYQEFLRTRSDGSHDRWCQVCDRHG